MYRTHLVWEYVICTDGSVIHTSHYPNECHSHHILRTTKLFDHWASASSGSQFKTCQSRSYADPSHANTCHTDFSFHRLAPEILLNTYLTFKYNFLNKKNKINNNNNSILNPCSGKTHINEIICFFKLLSAFAKKIWLFLLCTVLQNRIFISELLLFLDLHF